MTDKKIIASEMQNIQTYFECKADMSIGNGKMKLLSWANAVRDALELLKEQEAVKQNKWALKRQTFTTVRGWYCSNCNFSISYGDRYCRNCGREIKWDD